MTERAEDRQRTRPATASNVETLEVVFVDDDRLVLEALRDMLYRLRRDWNMHFLDSGEQALHHLASRPVDALVTDLRMGGMSGCTLLSEVRRRHARVARVILSGTAGACSPHLMTLAHAVLTKPCEPGSLEHTIGQVVRRVRSGLADP
jgi:DNA-binding NtrC family response regulator